MTNALIMRMRFYHYKELLKVFAQNCRTQDFESTKNSVIMFLLMPSAVSLGFNLMSPFSVIRNVAIYGAFGASVTCFVMSFKDDMHQVALKDDSEIGF
jgi:hypothetical protein